MKPYLLFFFLTLTTASQAQPWQWAIRGGCVNAMQRAQDYNNITHITTDQAGNVYTLGPVGSLSLQVDGHPLTAYSGFSPGASTDVLLSSFTASGQYRWAKVFGGGVIRLWVFTKNGQPRVCLYFRPGPEPPNQPQCQPDPF